MPSEQSKDTACGNTWRYYAKLTKPFDTDETDELYKSIFGDYCYLCGQIRVLLDGKRIEGVAVREHILPSAAGGLTALGNIALACSRCNGLKSSRDYRVLGLPSKTVENLREMEAVYREHTADWHVDEVLARLSLKAVINPREFEAVAKPLFDAGILSKDFLAGRTSYDFKELDRLAAILKKEAEFSASNKTAVNYVLKTIAEMDEDDNILEELVSESYKWSPEVRKSISYPLKELAKFGALDVDVDPCSGRFKSATGFTRERLDEAIELASFLDHPPSNYLDKRKELGLSKPSKTSNFTILTKKSDKLLLSKVRKGERAI